MKRLLADDDQSRHFRTFAEKVSHAYKKLGIAVKPFHCKSLINFNRLDSSSKLAAISRLNNQLMLTESTGEKSTGKTALWRAISCYGLVPGSELFGALEEADKIEIYSLDGIQIWRNLNVMEICSYTLEEIHSFSWSERYDRKTEFTNQIIATISKLNKLSKDEKIVGAVPAHMVFEKFSEEKLVLRVSHEHFFPLWQKSGELGAFLVGSKVEVVNDYKRPSGIRLVESIPLLLNLET